MDNKNTKKAAISRLRDSMYKNLELQKLLIGIRESGNMTQMQAIRNKLAELNQCIHEYSAYDSASKLND